jgi:hypothetical protein
LKQGPAPVDERKQQVNKNVFGATTAVRALGYVATVVMIVAATIQAPTTARGAPAPSRSFAKSGTCAGFTVTTGGVSYRGNQNRSIAASRVSPTIVVSGKYVRFTVNSSKFTVTNYTLTGANSGDSDKDLPIDAPVIVFKSKVPNHNDTLNSALTLRISNEGIVLKRNGVRQSIKIQAKDCAQGGLFQMEPQPSITETNTLGDTFAYTRVPAGQTRLCFTNGKFVGYDSPELATLVSRTRSIAQWRVQSGGRIGMVIGEDAEEGGC